MDAEEREAVCQRLSATRQHLGLPLKQVRSIDQYLEETWGITLPLPPGNWKERLEELAGEDLAGEFWALHDEQASYLEAGMPIPSSLVNVFYDVIADKKISGHVHSQKRTEILDAGCLLVYLVQELGIVGPVLDIGCHIGYHAQLLVKETDVSVCGIDRSSRAIDVAMENKNCDKLDFRMADLEAIQGKEHYEMVYAVRSIAMCKPVLRKLYSLLKPGGVAVILEDEAPDTSQQKRRAIREAGFGFGLADVVGGWIGQERGYEAGPALLFIKGRSRLTPADVIRQAKAAWGEFFRDYANDAGTPWREKTQAYCRGHLMDAERS